jgi:hypothetical protein
MGGRVFSVTDDAMFLNTEDDRVLTLARPAGQLDYLKEGRLVIVTSVPLERTLWAVGIGPGWPLAKGRETAFSPFFASPLAASKAPLLEREIVALMPTPRA